MNNVTQVEEINKKLKELTEKIEAFKKAPDNITIDMLDEEDIQLIFDTILEIMADEENKNV